MGGLRSPSALVLFIEFVYNAFTLNIIKIKKFQLLQYWLYIVLVANHSQLFSNIPLVLSCKFSLMRKSFKTCMKSTYSENLFQFSNFWYEMS